MRYKVSILPVGFTSKFKSIDIIEIQAEEAVVPMSVSISLEDDIDMSKGDTIKSQNVRPDVSQGLECLIGLIR